MFHDVPPSTRSLVRSQSGWICSPASRADIKVALGVLAAEVAEVHRQPCFNARVAVEDLAVVPDALHDAAERPRHERQRVPAGTLLHRQAHLVSQLRVLRPQLNVALLQIRVATLQPLREANEALKAGVRVDVLAPHHSEAH